MALRPAKTTHHRFLSNYVKGKCTVQPVGVHKVARVPPIVTCFLKLKNSSLYSGHCFRRTSASILANAGASLEDVKRHGGWRLSSVAEGYIDESENSKTIIATKILGKEQYCSLNNETCALNRINDSHNNDSLTNLGYSINNQQLCFLL